jgi:phosphatidylserine decarboxylase
MKHAGKASRAALRLLYSSLFFVVSLLLFGMLARFLSQFVGVVSSGLVVLWALFAIFCLYFFRDPAARVPSGGELIVAPAHGKVDVIDEVDEPVFMGGRCRRVSIFLSVLDVHIQNAPVAGRVALSQYSRGKFLNAIRADTAAHNENLFIGIESSERPGERVAVRFIAGLIARRIQPWFQLGDVVARGERLGLIQFGSRVEIYLPMKTQVAVSLGNRVRGGETVIGRRD